MGKLHRFGAAPRLDLVFGALADRTRRQLLAQLTRQVAVVQYPIMTNSTVRHVEVVPLTTARLMLVLITDSGRVDQRTVDLGDVITEQNVVRLRDVLNSALTGRKLSEAIANVSELPEQSPGELRDVLIRVSTALIESLLSSPSPSSTGFLGSPIALAAAPATSRPAAMNIAAWKASPEA